MNHFFQSTDIHYKVQKVLLSHFSSFFKKMVTLKKVPLSSKQSKFLTFFFTK